MTNLSSLILNKHALAIVKNQIHQMSLLNLERKFRELEVHERVLVYRLLQKDRAIQLFEQFNPEDQAQLIRDMEHPSVTAALALLDPHDRAEVLEELPGRVVQRLLRTISPQSREAINMLLGYADNSVGQRMTTRYIAIPERVSILVALTAIRATPFRADELDVILVTNAQGQYQGYVRLGHLVQALDPQAAIGELRQNHPVAVATTASHTEAVEKLTVYDVPVIPVIDSERYLVGVVTYNEVIDVIEDCIATILMAPRVFYYTSNSSHRNPPKWC